MISTIEKVIGYGAEIVFGSYDNGSVSVVLSKNGKKAGACYTPSLVECSEESAIKIIMSSMDLLND